MEPSIRDMINHHLEVVRRLDAATEKTLQAAADMLITSLAGGHKVLVCGNGGSAADAQHIAGELAGRFIRERPALACVALSTDTSVLTAIGNDYSYDYVFARQVEALGSAGDVLWGLTTSGNSPNVLRAAEEMKKRGGKVLGFTGRDGGKLKGLSDVCFISPVQETYAIQQIHQLAYHILCELVDRAADRHFKAES